MGIDVTVRAMIAQEQRLLLVRHSDDEYWHIPGWPVERGVPAEVGMLRHLTRWGAAVTFSSFVAAVEHGDAQCPGDKHELSLLFDVGVSNPGLEVAERGLHTRWIAWTRLPTVDLRPTRLRDALLSERFDDGDRWLPWRRR